MPPAHDNDRGMQWQIAAFPPQWRSMGMRPVRITSLNREPGLAKPNYGYEKRQRELAKKKKKDAKDARKREAREAARTDAPASPDPSAPEPVEAPTEAPGPRIHLRRSSD